MPKNQTQRPVCRMASQMAFVQVGVSQDTVVDVESEDSPLMGGRGESGF